MCPWKFFRISRIRNIAQTWFLARLFVYLYFFIFHFPDSRLSVLKGFLFYFWWLGSENHQLFPAWNGQLTLTFSFIVLEFEKLLYSPDLKMVLIFLVKKVLQKNEFMFHCHMRCSVTQWSATRLCASLNVCSKVPWVPPTPPVTLTQINGRIFEKVR